MLDRHHWPYLEAENQAELLAYLGTASCVQSDYAANITWIITGVNSNDYNLVNPQFNERGFACLPLPVGIWPRSQHRRASGFSISLCG